MRVVRRGSGIGEKAVELDEHYYLTRYIFGEAYLALGKLDEAIDTSSTRIGSPRGS